LNFKKKLLEKPVPNGSADGRSNTGEPRVVAACVPSGGVLYADLVGADQAPHTPQAGCWAGPINSNSCFVLLFRFFCLIFLFTFFKSWFFLDAIF
jgi:hypothetical protein